jgi:hypothetical protein
MTREEMLKRFGSPTQQQTSNNNSKSGGLSGIINKTGNFFGKALDFGTKITGVKSAVDLIGTAGEGFQYGANKILGDKQAQQQLLSKPQTEITQKAQTQGVGAAVKDIAGKSLEVAVMAAPYAKGIGLGIELAAPKLVTQFASKFPTMARYAGYGATGATYGGAFGTANALQENKNVIKEAITGATTGAIVGMAIPALVEGTVRAVKNVASLYSGVPKEAIEQAFNNPEKVGVAVRKYSQQGKEEEILSKAEKSLTAIRNQRNMEYQNALKEIKSEDMVNLSLDGVKDNITSTLESHNIKPLYKGVKNSAGQYNFSESALTSSQEKKLNELIEKVYTWKNTTAEGLNNLGKKINSYKGTPNEEEYNAIIFSLKKNLSNYVADNAPKIKAMNSAYGEASNFIDSLKKEVFGKTNNASNATKLNKLLSLFSQKSDIRKKLIAELGDKAGIDLINEITGSAMSSWLPTGWVQRFILAGGAPFAAGVGIPATLTSIGLASPRIVGKASRILGQLNRVAPPAAEKALPLILNASNKNKLLP